MEPIIGNIESAYDYYRLRSDDTERNKTLTREQTMPVFTNFTRNFYGTLDHLFYNKDKLEVMSLLETPELSDVEREGTLPSTLYPSDHVRIEAVFFIK